MEFQVATDRRDALRRATNISLLDESFAISGEKRERGAIAALKVRSILCFFVCLFLSVAFLCSIHSFSTCKGSPDMIFASVDHFFVRFDRSFVPSFLRSFVPRDK